MEIEVNEYIRDRAGHIRKVTRYIPNYENGLLCSDTCRFELDDNDEAIYTNKWLKAIVKSHSKDIIDLIEIGDIVEYDFYIGNVGISREITFIGDIKQLHGMKKEIKNNNFKLKSILTHEQYERNCYRLEG